MNSESGIVDNVKLVKQYAPDVERREHGRIDVRMGGDILLFATHPGWKEPKEFRVLDYSSLEKVVFSSTLKDLEDKNSRLAR
ncbi:hypothetical protein CH375_00685, partial [Leptospira ellisii]